MFGPFRPTLAALGGLLWKSPWRMSPTRKRRQRLRLRAVDNVMAALTEGMRQTNQSCRALDRAVATWRNESEMPAKDKYWIFSKKDRKSGYRKGAHKVPKWTKVSMREVPFGY